MNSWLYRIGNLPECNILLFALLLNFPWEILQMPLFATLPSATSWDIIKMCGLATIGDGLIMLFSFWIAAFSARSRYWFAHSARTPLFVFVATGLGISVAIELAATINGVWLYGPLMPLIFGVGLSPLMQWVMLPLLTILIIRRQLGGATAR